MIVMLLNHIGKHASWLAVYNFRRPTRHGTREFLPKLKYQGCRKDLKQYVIADNVPGE